MASEQPPRDLEDTDVYDVGKFPAPQPAPAPPRAPQSSPAAPIAGPPAAGPAPPAAPVAPVAGGEMRWQQQQYRPMPYGQAPYDTSGLAILSATLLLVFGIVGALLFGLLVAIWEGLARLSLGTIVRLETVESTRIVMIALLIVALAQVVAAIGVFAHRGWARLVGLAISVPGTVVGTLLLIAALARGLTLETWLAAVVLGAYGFSFFGLIAGNSHFRRLPRRW